MENTKELVHELITVSRMHHKCIENAARGLSLHQAGHRLLAYLSRQAVMPSQKEIAERFDISPAAVANSLKRLEKDGYIERTADEGDTRFNRIAITEKGKRVLDETQTLFSNVDEEVLKGFSNEERTLLSSYFARMKQNLAAFDGEEPNFPRKEPSL